MSSTLHLSVLSIFALSLLAPASAEMPRSCVPPPRFQDTPPPAIAPLGELVAHTEEVVVNLPLDQVIHAAEQTSLNQAIRESGALPGVSGTYKLRGSFGQPGSRRLVCLTDGSTTEEQVIENQRDGNSAEFKYVVWNYTTPKARPVLYGVGHFVRTDLGDGRTRVRWTYSFQLNRQRFPGFLGHFGDYLFRVGFLDREYAEMMRNTIKNE